MSEFADYQCYWPNSVNNVDFHVKGPILNIIRSFFDELWLSNWKCADFDKNWCDFNQKLSYLNFFNTPMYSKYGLFLIVNGNLTLNGIQYPTLMGWQWWQH